LCMYDITGRIRREIPNYQLSQEEQMEIYVEWLKTCVKKPDLLIKEFENKYALKP